MTQIRRVTGLLKDHSITERNISSALRLEWRSLLRLALGKRSCCLVIVLVSAGLVCSLSARSVASCQPDYGKRRAWDR